MEKTIDYHRLLPGLFDRGACGAGFENDEIVVGNRWSYRDLNSWIQENEPNFNFRSHSMLGGCCADHEAGKIIFPEEFTAEILQSLSVREGLYNYSCQYLNNPVPKDQSRFSKAWLRYYSVEPYTNKDRRAVIRHEVNEGEVIKDQFVSDLKIVMIVDPNHAGNHGRCRHAITVHGIQSKPTFKWFLLDCWAESCSYEKFVREIFKRVHYWRLSNFWLETVAAQKYLKLYLDLVKKSGKTVDNDNKPVESPYVTKCTINELRIDYSPNAKERRIDALNPYFAEKRFWVRRTHAFSQEFVGEYEQYPHGRLVDILDTCGYLPQTLEGTTHNKKSDIKDFLRRKEQKYMEDARAYSTLAGA